MNLYTRVCQKGLGIVLILWHIHLPTSEEFTYSVKHVFPHIRYVHALSRSSFHTWTPGTGLGFTREAGVGFTRRAGLGFTRAAAVGFTRRARLDFTCGAGLRFHT